MHVVEDQEETGMPETPQIAIPKKVIYLDDDDLEVVFAELLDKGVSMEAHKLDAKPLNACIWDGDKLEIVQHYTGGIYYSQATIDFLSEPRNRATYVDINRSDRKKNCKVLRQKHKMLMKKIKK